MEAESRASKIWSTLVRLESWELLSRWFIIFTGEKYSFLFGVLELPKKKVAWFDP